MGWPLTSGSEEEDVAHEEAASADGRQGAEGRDGVEQVQCVWAGEESACAVSVLRTK